MTEKKLIYLVLIGALVLTWLFVVVLPHNERAGRVAPPLDPHQMDDSEAPELSLQ